MNPIGPIELDLDGVNESHVHVSYELADVPVVFCDSRVDLRKLLTVNGSLVFENRTVLAVVLHAGGVRIQSHHGRHVTPGFYDSLVVGEEGVQLTPLEAMNQADVLERIEELARRGDPVDYIEGVVAEYDALMATMPRVFGSDRAYHDWCRTHGLAPYPIRPSSSYYEHLSVRHTQDARLVASQKGAVRRSLELMNHADRKRQDNELNANRPGQDMPSVR